LIRCPWDQEILTSHEAAAVGLFASATHARDEATSGQTFIRLGNNAVASFHIYCKVGHYDFIPDTEFSKDVVDAV
jgi:hypothetical protein